MVLYGHFNPLFVVDHLVSNLLLYGTHMVSKIPNDWPQEKRELYFLETLPLDTRFMDVIS